MSEKVNDSATRLEKAEEKVKNTAEALSGVLTRDAFSNAMARLGYGQPNLAEGGSYELTRMTYDYRTFNAMYRGSWIARKIIDTVPSDMLKNWITIRSDLEPDKIGKIESAFKKTRTKAKIKEALQWARLYGGAAALIIIDGQDDMLDQPIDYDTITPDSYKGLLVFDRWSGVFPSNDLINDINEPDFGLPEFYTISTNNVNSNISENAGESSVNGMKVHHSRIIRFTGRELPMWEKQAEMYWGESEMEVVMEELKKRDNTSSNIAALIFLANIRVLKMDDLGEMLGSASETAKTNLYNVLEAQNQLMSNMGIYVMNKDDDFDTKQYSFGGLNDIYESFMLDIAGAAEMPVTKLFGRAPAGFNSTGESDLNQYYDTIESKQEDQVAPVIEKLLPIISLSAIGTIPDDLDWEFNPVKSVSNKDLADLSSSYTDTIDKMYNSGIIDKATSLRELKQQSDITGIFTNITDEQIEAAENEPDVSEQDQEDITNEINAPNEGENQGIDEGSSKILSLFRDIKNRS